MGTDEPNLLKVNDRVGAFRVVRKLGQGGMGAVFEAIHDAIERRVAIKVLHGEFARTPEVATRFFNEARAVNRIAHPGLVQISDFGHLPDGSAYIVMEFLDGETVGQRLARLGGKLPPAEVIELVTQIADALSAAHQKGIIHRDLKPDNVMLLADPHLPGGLRSKLLDFGIAKLADDAGSAAPRTQTQAMLGTPQYMSPEQCKGPRNVDEKSDVYSLGVMLYRMLSGQVPFTGEGAGEIVAKHIYEEPPSLAKLAPELPPALVALTQRLLSKNKHARPTMAELVTELAAISGSAPRSLNRRQSSELSVPHLAAGGKPATSQPASLSLAGYVQTAGPGRSRTVIATGVALALVLGLVGTSLQVKKNAAKDRLHGATAAVNPTQAATKKVQLSIVSIPVGAEVVRTTDGLILGRTPFVTEHPAGVDQLSVKLHLAGYREHSLLVALDHDVQLQEKLEPLSTQPEGISETANLSPRDSAAHPSKRHKRRTPQPGKKEYDRPQVEN